MKNVFIVGILFIILFFSCDKKRSNQDDDKSVPLQTSLRSLPVKNVPKLIRKENILSQTQGYLYSKFHFSDDLSKAISWDKNGLKLWDVASQRILKSFDYNVVYAQLNHDGSQILLNYSHSSKSAPLLIDSHSGEILKTYHRMIYAEFTNMEPAIKTSERRVEEKMMSQDGRLAFGRGKYNSPSGYLVAKGRNGNTNLHVKFKREIKNVAFSKDNSLVAIAADNKIQFYHYHEGQIKEAHQIPYKGVLYSMAFSQDNKLLQLSYLDKETNSTLEVRAVDSGESLYVKENTKYLFSKHPPLFSADGQFVFVPEHLPEIESRPKSYRMVKINWATQERVFETEAYLYNQTIYLTSDEKNLVIGNAVFDANTGRKKVELKYHLNEIGYFDINKTGNLWVFNNFNQTFIFDKKKQSTSSHKSGYWEPSKKGFEEYGYYTASNYGMRGGSLLGEEIGDLIKKEVDPEKLAEAQRIIEQEYKKMEESAEKQGGFGTAIAMEYFSPGSPLAKVDLSLFQKAQQGEIYSAAYSPNGKYIAAISNLGRVYLLNARTKKIIMILPTLNEEKGESIYDEMSQIFFSHNSQIVIYENTDADKIVFSIPQRDTLFTIDAGSWHDAILHPKKEKMLLAKKGNILEIVDLKSGKKQFETKLDTSIKYFKYANNGDEIMVITTEQEIFVYDAITGDLVDSGAFEKKGRIQYAGGNLDHEWACHNKLETYISIFQNDYHCYDFYPISDGDWVAISPNGYFDGTEKGLGKLYFSDGQKTKSLAEFPDTLHLKGMLNMEETDLSKMAEMDILEFF